MRPNLAVKRDGVHEDIKTNNEVTQFTGLHSFAGISLHGDAWGSGEVICAFEGVPLSDCRDSTPHMLAEDAA